MPSPFLLVFLGRSKDNLQNLDLLEKQRERGQFGKRKHLSHLKSLKHARSRFILVALLLQASTAPGLARRMTGFDNDGGGAVSISFCFNSQMRGHAPSWETTERVPVREKPVFKPTEPVREFELQSE
ncbi:hypothetical protein ACFX2I_014863 [Malus domestica]